MKVRGNCGVKVELGIGDLVDEANRKRGGDE